LGTIRAFSATWRRSFIHPLELEFCNTQKTDIDWRK
jgi:hypothetical protein